MMASVNGIFFSCILSTRSRALLGWPPSLKALIRATHAMVSSLMSLVTISSKIAYAFSQCSDIQILDKLLSIHFHLPSYYLMVNKLIFCLTCSIVCMKHCCICDHIWVITRLLHHIECSFYFCELTLKNTTRKC